MGPEEFLEGLGIGLRSFVGGTVGTFVILPVHLTCTWFSRQVSYIVIVCFVFVWCIGSELLC